MANEIDKELESFPEALAGISHPVVRPKSRCGKEKETTLPPPRPPYKHLRHTQNAFCHLIELRKHRQLCDVCLVADDGNEIYAHRCILAACSPYFNAMFTNELTEATQDRIQIKDIDGGALTMLIDFIYEAEIRVHEESVQTLLPAANILQLLEVRDACCDFLQAQLHPSNCLGIKAFADHHSCHDLLNYAAIYTQQHFSDVTSHEEFCSLSASQICNLISSDRLTASEEQVFESIIRWTNHDLVNRQEYFPQLLSHVRLALLPQEYLIQKVQDNALVKSSSQCKDYLIEALTYHLLRPEKRLEQQQSSLRLKPRTPVGLPKILLVIGGQAPKAIRSVEVYDFNEDSWCAAADMPSRRCRCGVATLNGQVYAVGGFNGSLRVRTVDVYDPIKDIWTSVANMEARRSTLGAAVLNGKIYAVGGFDGSSGLISAEVYDPETDDWTAIASMSTRRSSVGVGTLKGLVYAVGGYDGASRQCLSSVEAYEPGADIWHSIPDMCCRRSGAGVGILNELLYAVGGHDGPLVRKSVEVYCQATRQWTQVADMHLCRRNAGVMPHGGKLYVVGGDDGSSNLPSVEVYDPSTDAWILLATAMVTGRSYAGTTIIDKPL